MTLKHASRAMLAGNFAIGCGVMVMARSLDKLRHAAAAWGVGDAGCRNVQAEVRGGHQRPGAGRRRGRTMTFIFQGWSQALVMVAVAMLAASGSRWLHLPAIAFMALGLSLWLSRRMRQRTVHA